MILLFFKLTSFHIAGEPYFWILLANSLFIYPFRSCLVSYLRKNIHLRIAVGLCLLQRGRGSPLKSRCLSSWPYSSELNL